MTYLFLGNSPGAWGIACAVAIITALLLSLARDLVFRRLSGVASRTPTRLDDIVVNMLGSTSIIFILIMAVYFGSTFLQLPPAKELVLERLAKATLLIQMALWGDSGLRGWRDYYRNVNCNGDPARLTTAATVCFLMRVTLWLVIILMILDNMGFNITTLVASLGIGGIAVALAVQNILGDLFASLSIVLDKPFVIGDFIVVDKVMGTVEYIGLKTTRVRSLSGEQIVFANGDLLKSRIHNHKRMETRRAAFVIRVTYQTTEDQLSRIPSMIKDIVMAQKDTAFERAHFSAYGEWALEFEVVYHVASPDYNLHMDLQQSIFLALHKRFANEGIQFAHPTHLVHLVNNETKAPAGASLV